MDASQKLSRLLEESGAVAFGWTQAAPVEESEWNLFTEWLARGFHAGMAYMERYQEIRRDPRLLLSGARTIISVAFNYRQPNPFRGVATYALGQDYHKVLRKRLKRVAASMKEEFGGDWRICIDSAPLLERYWAEKCGVGFRSPVHGNIVVPGVGSMVFLAEIITTLQLPPSPLPDSFERYGENTTGNQICPTGALQPGGMVDARKCINYLTIEHRGELSPEEKTLTGGAFFGCDICQKGCPENSGEAPGVLPEFLPMNGLGDFIKGRDCDFELGKSPMSRRFRNTPPPPDSLNFED